TSFTTDKSPSDNSFTIRLLGRTSPPQGCLSPIQHGLKMAEFCDDCPELMWISEGVRKESSSSI
ncbi:hypothetical protein AVEN_114639-1, partial [Araneus ventricosus]